jgi:hypothetical protein
MINLAICREDCNQCTPGTIDILCMDTKKKVFVNFNEIKCPTFYSFLVGHSFGAQCVGVACRIATPDVSITNLCGFLVVPI